MGKRPKIIHGYFSRFLLLNTGVFLIAMALLVSLAFTTVYRKQQEAFYRESEKVVGVLLGEMEKKHTSFYQVLYRMYENGGVQAILDLFDSSGAADMQENPALRRQLFDYVDDAVVTDDSISMVLFYQREEGDCYVYDRHSRTFNAVDPSFPFFQELIAKEQLRITMPSRTVVSSGRGGLGFAIGGNLSPQDFSNPPGYIAVVFSTQVFASSIQSLGRDLPVEYAIVLGDSGTVVFDSASISSGTVHGPQVYKPDNGDYLSTSYHDEQRNYLYLSRIHTTALTQRSQGTLLLVAAGILMVVVVFALMLGYTIRSTAARIRELLGGMERLGQNDFSVRLVVRGTSDEFDQLSEHFNMMCDQLQDNIRKAYVYELQKKHAELGELQSRVNPHFLSNTIESLRSMISQRHFGEVDEMMLLLARYYRLMVMGSAFVSLQEELDAAGLYLDMMSLRYADRFAYDMEIEEGVERIGVIRNILQPVLENFFQHGFRADSDDNQLHVHVHGYGNRLFIRISDNGRGMTPEVLQALRTYIASDAVLQSKGYGLASVASRLRLVYGPSAHLEIEAWENEGCEIAMECVAEPADSLAARMKGSQGSLTEWDAINGRGSDGEGCGET